MQVRYKQNSTATSDTVTCDDVKQDMWLVHNASSVATLTIALPATPQNLQSVTISSNGGIIALNLTTAVGSIINAITTLAVGGTITYTYDSSLTFWIAT
jgi:hypothetical protein